MLYLNESSGDQALLLVSRDWAFCSFLSVIPAPWVILVKVGFSRVTPPDWAKRYLRHFTYATGLASTGAFSSKNSRFEPSRIHTRTTHSDTWDRSPSR